jgi:sulfate adenylyltransferase subunit 1 (EFTu-like GTPase family)
MDLVNYDLSVFTRIEAEFREFISRFQTIEPYFIPISALKGDNVVTHSGNMPWYRGPNLLEYLERVPVGNHVQRGSFRFPVQRVVRPDQEFRGYSGTIASGRIAPGDPVVVLPSGRKTSIDQIITFDGHLDEASAGQSVTFTLADEADIGRGDVIASLDAVPQVSTSIEATLVWLNDTPAELKKSYRLKHTTRQASAELKQISHRVDINSLDHQPAQTLEMNAIGVVQIETSKPLVFDEYSENRIMGSFILIDPATNATVAAGLINRAIQAAKERPNGSGPFTWRVENGSLLLTGLEGPHDDTHSQPIDDPEALAALSRLLDRLGLAASR